MDDPFEQVTAALADASERLVRYAEVWRDAVRRNAEGEYAADDFLVDLQTVWGMGVSDAARVGSAFVEVFAPLLSRDDFGSRERSEDQHSEGSADVS